MLIAELLEYIDQSASFSLQEDYDNSGLIIGTPSDNAEKALISIDVTEDILDEAIQNQCNLIISHHPLIFSGLKKIGSKTETERVVVKAIRNDISILALHTNLDNHAEGVNAILCRKLGILNPKILRPLHNRLFKLVTFCPENHAEKVRTALFQAGAGHIGNYDSCSFNSPGQGTFRALAGAKPFVGQLNSIHVENEQKIEVIFPTNIENKLLEALFSNHPYEEVAYDIYPLKNTDPYSGAGMIGHLQNPVPSCEFLRMVKDTLNIGCIRHTSFQKTVKKIALCGGSGSFLIRDALNAKADAFLCGDIKYHDFFIPENKMLLADIGHYESEQFTKELIFTLLNKKFPTFALRISERSTNPVNYL